MDFDRKLTYNKTTYFLIPLCDIQFECIKKVFVNAYLGNSKYENLNENYNIFIELINDDNIHPIIVYLKENKNYVTHYNLNLNDSIIFVINIPEQYRHDYDLFILGKYNSLTYSTKQLILQQHGHLTGAIWTTSTIHDELVDYLCIDYKLDIKDPLEKIKAKSDREELRSIIYRNKEVLSIIDKEVEYLRDNNNNFKQIELCMKNY